MTRFNKFLIIIIALVLILLAGDFVFAKGYFLEKGNEFFVFDKLYINGYLTVGTELRSLEGRFGDVILSGNLNLDNDSKFIFCKDEHDPESNVPINRDCSKKVLIWQPEKLEVVGPSLYSMAAESYYAENDLVLESAGSIKSNVDVHVSGYQLVSGVLQDVKGCLVNDGTENCSDITKSELITKKVFLTSLGSLDNSGAIDIYGGGIHFNAIFLEDSTSQDVCFLRNPNTACPAGARGQYNFKSPTFNAGASYNLTVQYQQVCCYLIIDNF